MALGMLIWQWGLIASSVFFFLVFITVLLRYLYLKKNISNADEGTNSDERGESLGSHDAISEDDKKHWLSLLGYQKKICTTFLSELPKTEVQSRSALSCWLIFLDIEIQIIEHGIPNEKIPELLNKFKAILDKIDRAQEIDNLFKSLKVNQSLLNELNKVIQKTGEKVFSQVDITAELNAKLEKLQKELEKEPEIDAALANLRAEISTMCELAERLKLHLEEVKRDDGDHASYINALEEFLDGAEQSTFLDSMGEELDNKVSDLKQLAAHQKEIIADLKEEVRKVRTGEPGDRNHIGAHDIAIARFEKSLLESDRVMKRLQGKLENLQTIKYNLNIDMMKRDETIKEKTALLDSKQATSSLADIYDVFEQEHDAMQNMENLLHQGELTAESDAYASGQSSKISSLRAMVNESELYVEMLEMDLDKARELREELEDKLKHPEDVVADDLNDEREVENLIEINSELEEEKKRLESELLGDQDQAEELTNLNEKINQLDEQIEAVQVKYVEMEERYLNALMSNEDP